MWLCSCFLSFLYVRVSFLFCVGCVHVCMYVCFDLSAQEFRDGLALRYRKPLLSLPSVCDGCGAPFSVDHALDCRFGGVVTCRHNEVRDAFGDLASLVWSPVVKEPIVCPWGLGATDRGIV